MSNVLTTLRELSVAFFFFNEKSALSAITPKYFIDQCCANIGNLDRGRVVNFFQGEAFSAEELNIIKNGLVLGKEIGRILAVSKPSVEWVGGNTQSGIATDLIIAGKMFSLKENSFILENMGLYKLLNILKGDGQFKRGLHVFKSFSPNELNQWFVTTRDLLIRLGPQQFRHNGGDYISTGGFSSGALVLQVQKGGVTKRSTIPSFASCTYEKFIRLTQSGTREKVFCKWIKVNVEGNPKYIEAKERCASAAGKALVSYVGSQNSGVTERLLRLFRIEAHDYYYAKSTDTVLEVYRVPSMAECSRTIQLKSFYYSVPSSQLNMFTVIENEANGRRIVLRNELRYSHGQFNGTPEAKLYIEKGDLSIIYEKLV